MGDETTEVATLGGGCFWCLEAVFKELRGVKRVVSGYSGGHTETPSYREVCAGTTGHAEVVQVHFDPSVITYREILEVFFAIHDPTTRDRQGADVGTQYRSAIFLHSDEQREVARDLVAFLTGERVFDDPIVTELVPFERFWPAEEYHLDYYARNESQPYCRFVVAPKLAKFRRAFAEKRVQPMARRPSEEETPDPSTP
jgi:peptide-methionine (S)-S-oxide reductase